MALADESLHHVCSYFSFRVLVDCRCAPEETVKTLQENWKEYRDAVYPKGTGPQQNLECHQAFMAGALCMLQAVETAAALPVSAELAKLKNEVWEINAHRAHVAKARN